MFEWSSVSYLSYNLVATRGIDVSPADVWESPKSVGTNVALESLTILAARVADPKRPPRDDVKRPPCRTDALQKSLMDLVTLICFPPTSSPCRLHSASRFPLLFSSLALLPHVSIAPSSWVAHEASCYVACLLFLLVPPCSTQRRKFYELHGIRFVS